MIAIEYEILARLRELENAVRKMRAANPKPDLGLLFSQLDVLTASLPAETSGALLHFLQRKSYEKARLFLEERETERQAGSCPR